MPVSGERPNLVGSVEPLRFRLAHDFTILLLLALLVYALMLIPLARKPIIPEKCSTPDPMGRRFIAVRASSAHGTSR